MNMIYDKYIHIWAYDVNEICEIYIYMCIYRKYVIYK